MARFYIINVKDLNQLEVADGISSSKKTLFGRKKAPVELLTDKLEEIAIETIIYKWPDISLAILAVFSKERLQADWDYLEHNRTAGIITEKYNVGAYIFSPNDLELMKIKPNGYFYSLQELDQFAEKFEGRKPANPQLMKNAAKFLEDVLSRLKPDNVAVLLME